MSPRRAAAVAASAVVVLAAGCGGGESGAPVATTDVAMAKSYRFEPRVTEARAGSTVTWTNQDNFTHTVTPEVGCDACFAELDRYVELELAGEDADAALPRLRAHLEGCPACREEHDSLRALVAGE